MRVLVVAPSFFPSIYWGGPTTAMHSLCNALASLPSLEIEVLTTDAAGPGPEDRVVVRSNPDTFPAGYKVRYCRRVLFTLFSPELLRALPGMIARVLLRNRKLAMPFQADLMRRLWVPAHVKVAPCVVHTMGFAARIAR